MPAMVTGGRMDPRARAELMAADQLRDKLREQYPERALIRTPWGWSSYVPHTSDEIQGTLAEIAKALEKRTPGRGQGSSG